MAEIIESLPFIFGALLAVTFIDSVGSIASRRLDFDYGYLSVLSITVYSLLGFFVGKVGGLNMVLIASIVTGFYDATVGLKLSKVLKANIKLGEEFADKLTYSHSLMAMLVVAPLFAFIGYLFS